MKTKSYKYGKFYFKAYYRSAGNGYEVGLTFRGRNIFVGNFIHSEEAKKWYSVMNKETAQFVKKYWVTDEVSTNWYGHFFSNHLYKTYYKHLDTWFAKYNKNYSKAFSRDFKKYKSLKKNWSHEDAATFKAA